MLRRRTSFSRAYTMYSRLVSLKPPFLALQRGVRMASVMTMSSAFLDWLEPGVSLLSRTRLCKLSR